MKTITRENVSEVAEEIKNILLTTTDTAVVVSSLADYGINLNPMMDKQKIIDLTFATFETDRFHSMLLDYAGIQIPVPVEASPANSQSPEGGEYSREEGMEVLSQNALNDLFAGLDDEKEEQENKNDQGSNVLSQDDLNDLFASMEDDDE